MIEQTSKSKSRRAWVEKEDAQVIAALQRHTKLRDVADELEGQLDRSWGAIMNRARILAQNVPEFHQANTRRRWTAKDNQYLQDHWGQQTPAEIAAHLERSVGAVKVRAAVLGFVRQNRKQHPHGA